MFSLFKRKQDPLKAGLIKTKNFSKRVHFRNDGGLILIDITIAKKAYTFMLDTGAFSVVPSSLLDTTLLTQYDESIQTLDASGHTQEKALYRLQRLEVSGVIFEGFSVIVDDFSQHFPLSCLKFDGILGYNFLQNIILNIDYKNSLINLSDRLIQPDSFELIKMRSSKTGALEFRLHINKKDYWVGLDSGKNDGLMIGDEKLIKTLQKKDAFLERTTGAFSSDFSGINQHSFIDKYLLEDFSIDKKIPIKSYLLFYEKNSLNIVGNEFLANFNVTIDFRKKRLYLKALKKEINEKHKKSFGFLTFWSEDKKLFISAITQDTPAYHSKLKIGDRIMSINELDCLNFTKGMYCKYFLLSNKNIFYKEDESKLNIIVKRESKLLRITLELEKESR